MARRKDGPLRTNLSADRAASNRKLHRPERRRWRRTGLLRWETVLVCHICSTPYPCWWLRDAQEVLDGPG